MKTRILSYAVILLVNFFSVPCQAASSVYIPGVPSASSSAIGISCQYNYPGSGCIFCQNSSPSPLVSSAGVLTQGYSRRVIFYTPGGYSWSVPTGVTTMKAVVIGGGGGGVNFCCGNGSGGGGGYSEKTYSVKSAQSISVTVGSGGSGSDGGSSSITINSVTISATGGRQDNSGGAGSGGDINTYGEGGGQNTGGGAGGPYGNGCCGGWFGGLGLVAAGLESQSGWWWDTRDIVGLAGISGAPCTQGGLGAPGGSVLNTGSAGYGGNGGFGAGGGYGGNGSQNPGNGGIGGGGASGNGNGGNGIAILYW